MEGAAIEGEYIVAYDSSVKTNIFSTLAFSSIGKAAQTQYGIMGVQPFTFASFRAFHLVGDHANVCT